MSKIQKALEDINEQRRRLDVIESFLKQHQVVLEKHAELEAVSTSCVLTPDTIYLYAGKLPKSLANYFGGTFRIQENTWRSEYKDFEICFMDATEQQEVVFG